MRSRDSGLIVGKMVDYFKANGKIIAWKGWECIHGRMVKIISENTRMIRNMDLAFINKERPKFILENGNEENSQV